MNKAFARPTIVAIFGATSDIAVAVARRYATAGCRLILVGRDVAGLAALASDLGACGAGEILSVNADFERIEDFRTLVRDAWNHFEGIDIALIAYGTQARQPEAEQDPALAGKVLTVNFTSPAILLNELANRFYRQRKGAIAAITSVAGDRGRASNYFYGAAKGGLQRLLEGLRHRLAPVGVDVVDIRPGPVVTKMTAQLERKGLLWADVDQVAGDIVAAIQARRSVCYTPGFWRLVMAAVRVMPRWVFHRTSL